MTSQIGLYLFVCYLTAGYIATKFEMLNERDHMSRSLKKLFNSGYGILNSCHDLSYQEYRRHVVEKHDFLVQSEHLVCSISNL